MVSAAVMAWVAGINRTNDRGRKNDRQNNHRCRPVWSVRSSFLCEERTECNRAGTGKGTVYQGYLYQSGQSPHGISLSQISFYCQFDQIYATSAHFSWTDAQEFRKFCRDADIPCEDLPVGRYFKDGVCDGAFLTKEYTYDAFLLRDYLLEQLAEYPNVELRFEQRITRIVRKSNCYEVYMVPATDGNETGVKETRLEAPFVLNSTYASVNQVLGLIEGVDTTPFALKYELCEIILCKVSDKLENIGLTVMDGPFFSIMPFGKTGYHSLTSVTFTPHQTSYEKQPQFPCAQGGSCTPGILGNCNRCTNRPESAWEYMAALARKYMKDEYAFTYDHSLFSMKPILKASEVDDSRPTVIKFASTEPTFVSVLSGKINTIYDLDEILV